MDFDLVLLKTRAADIRARGLWEDRTIQHYFEGALQTSPDKTAIVAYRHDSQTPRRISYRELDSLVRRIAASLTALGVVRHDVVSFQLPNWWEFFALSLACVRIGATANPLMPIFREHELGFMLGMTESKVFVVPKFFRGHDYAAMATNLKKTLPCLEHVIVVDGDGDDSFDKALLQERPDEAELLRATTPLQPDDVLLVMFSSGTTGEPKGICHTSNTMLYSVRAIAERLQISPELNVLGATPLGHLTGYAIFFMAPILLGNTAVLQDVWQVDQALRIIEDEKVGFAAGSTPFLVDLCNAVAKGAKCFTGFRLFLCAGAPIPPPLVVEAAETMNLTVCSAWGMTEVVAGSITPPERAAEKSSVSDGLPLPAVEFRIADDAGSPLPVRETGRLLVKSPALFAGYLKRPELSKLDASGWFDTGDLAFADDEGYIRINGRSKDIIIRCGENIPVIAVENMLYLHPAVAMVAVVGFPDPRMGERACAFVVPKPGMSFTFEDMLAHCDACKLTKQYWPERLEIIKELPMTTTGKVQKFQLRELAKNHGDALKA